MKLYTEEQLLDICQSVAEKACANSLSKSFIKDSCDYYGYSKIEIDLDTIKHFIDDDNINKINLSLFYIA